MKILVLQNSLKFEMTSELESVRKFFEPYISLSFEIRKVNFETSIETYKIVDGFDKNTGLKAKVKLMGLTSAIRAKCQAEGYGIVMFAWDQDTVNIPADAAVTSWTTGVPLNDKTEFVQLALNQYFKDMKKIDKAVSHETLHALCKVAIRTKGIAAVDEMDDTVVNGKIVPFYKNDDPYAADGNYAHTLKNLKPFFDSLKATPLPQIGERVLKLTSPMMVGDDVKALQSSLTALGYLKGKADGIFGKMTETGLVAFQMANGLVGDGKAGKATNARISELSKPVAASAGIDQWKLSQTIKPLAVQFLALAKKNGYDLKITQGYRSPKYQDELYAQGRTSAGKIVTNATSDDSKHCKGLAFDIAFTGKVAYPANADWKKIGQLGKSCGLKWGGDFKSFVDLLHFEI